MGEYHDQGFLTALMEEFIQCQRVTCTDVHPAVCASPQCDSDIDPSKWMSVLFDDARWQGTQNRDGQRGIDLAEQARMVEALTHQFGSVRVAHLCPVACQACGPQGAQLQVAPCQPGWDYADGACFKYNFGFEQFRLIMNRTTKSASRTHPLLATWLQAEGSCQAEGAHLATIGTPAQEHLVFQLVKQRPPVMNATGLWAWVGLWSGPAGCSQASNWSWVGSPRSGVSELLVKGAKCQCDGTTACGPNAFYTNNLSAGETLTLSAALSTQGRRAWICSKPALLRAVTEGSCRDSGLLPIGDLETCEAAAGPLLGMGRVGRRWPDSAKPSGCFVEDSAVEGVRFSKHAAGEELTAEPGARILLCAQANGTVNATGQQAPTGVTGTTQAPGTRRSLPVTPNETVFSRPVLALVFSLGLLPVGALAAASARDLAPKLRALQALRPWRLLRASSGEKRFSMAVSAKLQRSRDTTAIAAALMLACFHLAELLRVSVATGAVCKDGWAKLRHFLAAVHLANVWAAAGFLAFRRCRAHGGSAVPRLAFLAVALVLEMAETALSGEQALLLESRLYRQLLGRLFLGACTSPALALAGNALLTLGMCVTYRVFVPDNMVFTVGSTRGAIFTQQGCGKLWEAANAGDIKTGIIGLADSLNRQQWSLRSAGELIESALQKRTSFASFAFSEALLFAVVAMCLLLLHFVLHRDISQSLRLESSEDQITAVSQMLGTLCDATFELSSDYRIAAPAPKLDTLVHLSPSPLGMQGRDFRDMVSSSEDRSRLEEQLSPGTEKGVLAGEAMYLDLKSAANASLRVELLCAQFADTAGERRLICGVNELHKEARGAGGDPQEALGPLLPTLRAEEPLSRTPLRGRGTPAAARSDVSGSLSDRGSPNGSPNNSDSERSKTSERSKGKREKCSDRLAGRKGREPGSKDVSRDDFTLEITSDRAKVCSASVAFKSWLGIELKTGRKLTTLTPDPEGLLNQLRSCVEGGQDEGGAPREKELRMVVNAHTFLRKGGREVRPYELRCRAEVVASPSAAASSGPEPPTVRLHVLSTHRLDKQQVASPDQCPPSSSSDGGVAPEQIGRSREHHIKSL